MTYSGTVAGALEGALLGIPSIAVSAQRVRDDCEFGPAAKAAALVTELVLERGMPKFTLLNINVPAGSNKGFRVRCRRSAITSPSSASAWIRGIGPYYWIEEGENDWEPHDRSDYQAVRDGYISITPLQPDMTAHDALSTSKSLPLVGEAEVR